jgi:multidrug efflux pump subunit AcrA (membrane-fusion protein)
MQTIEARGNAISLTFPAEVEAGDRVDLSFRVSGRLVEVPASSGAAFLAGDMLARLEARDFENRLLESKSNLAAAEAELAALRAGSRAEDIALLEAQFASAVARSSQADSEFNRQRQMFERGLIAESEFERATTARVVAARDADTVREQLAKAKNGARPEDIQAAAARVEALQSRVQDAEAALEDTILRAPFDGEVGSVYIDNYQDVQSKQPIVSFQNTKGLQLVIDLPERLVLHRRRGGDVRFEAVFAGHDSERFEATLRSVSPEADPQTRTYRVKLGLDAPESIDVLPGMSAEVLIEARLDETQDAPVRLPIEAADADSATSPVVWVVEPKTGTVAPRPVQLGRMVGNDIEVLDGLEVGETVVVAGVSQLREGMRVRPMGS